jgi:hypothetical protein
MGRRWEHDRVSDVSDAATKTTELETPRLSNVRHCRNHRGNDNDDDDKEADCNDDGARLLHDERPNLQTSRVDPPLA